MNLKISEIEIIPVRPQNGLIAFCSFVINEALYCSSVAIFTRPEGGYRLVYPTKKAGTKNMNIFYPIRQNFGKYVEEKVIEKLEEVIKNNDRYSCNDTL